MARTAPMNGANEKYAPVRAAPRCRRARTKSTRLTPIPKKPTIAMAPVMLAAGKAAPLSMASPVFTVPAARPLIVAVSTGSAEDSFRVRLLSIPQARQAEAINSAPMSSSIPCPRQESTVAPARIAQAPSNSRRSTFSRNTSQAIPIVKRPSRLSSSEPEDASVRARPSIKRSGPTSPPNSTTAASHRTSRARNGASGAGTPRPARAKMNDS